MNKFVSLISKLCFLFWLLYELLPLKLLMEYKMFIILYKTGFCINIIIVILAITATILPIISRRKEIDFIGKGKLILHDLDIENAEKVFKNCLNTDYIYALKKMAKCNGCFGCWLRTPGICVKHDGAENIGMQMSGYEELIIISKNLYGGFSKSIKNILDRSISFSLPFFAVRNNEQHHQMRYKKNGKLRVFIYNSYEITEIDKSTLIEITRANSINMNISNYETIFVNDVSEFCEVIK